MSVGKKMTGETLQIFTAGHTAGMKSMVHGQADSLVRSFRTLREDQQAAAAAAAAAAPSSPSADDPIAQIERLASLRDRGLLNNGESKPRRPNSSPGCSSKPSIADLCAVPHNHPLGASSLRARCRSVP